MVRRTTLRWWGALSLLLPSAAAAQTLRGRVTSADSSRGLSGVIVLLRDPSGREVARTLSTSTGSYVLRAPAAGSYRVRTLRIGYRPGDFGPYMLSLSREDNAVLALADIPVSLAAVRVSAPGECRSRDADGGATLEIWEEARKALLASVIARTDVQPTVSTFTYTRAIDPRTQRVIQLTTSRQTGPSARPFLSVLAPEAYAERGYEEVDSSGTITLRAPDADVLLSEAFAGGRCFSATRDARDTARVGLAFRPARERPGIVDVEGTMWVDRHTGELRAVDFHYVGVDPLVAHEGAGGELRFLRLDNGLWLIDHWLLRMPRLAVDQRRDPISNQALTRRSIADVWESGGEITRATLGSFEFSRPLPVIAGQLTEEGSQAPAVRATISLDGTDYRATSDVSGRFEIPGVLAGTYRAEVRSTAATALGDDAAIASDIVVTAPRTTVALKAPSWSEALRRACGEVRDSLGVKGSAVLQGVVRGTNGAPIRDATVVARWLGSADIKGGQAPNEAVWIYARPLNASTTTDRTGRYRICGVPPNMPLRVTATHDSLVSNATTIRVNDQVLVGSLDLALTHSIREVGADGSRIVGVVRDEAGHPLAGVDVAALGSDQTHATSDAAGKYALGGLSAGTYLVRYRRLGYAQALVSVAVGLDDEAAHDLDMHKAAQTLDTIVIRDSAITALRDPTGFAHRKATGMGFYLDEAQIEHRQATSTDQLLRTIPSVEFSNRCMISGISLSPGGGGASSRPATCPDSLKVFVQHGMQNLLGGSCSEGVQVVVDGIQMPYGFNINEIVPSQIKAIELYKDSATLPAELWSLTGSRCGTLAIWTK